MLSSGITWWTDKFIKFQNPNSNDLASAFAGKSHTLVECFLSLCRNFGVYV